MKIHGCLSSVLTATGMCCYSAMAGAAGYQIQEQSV
jgi:hypothetical protein